MSFINLTYLGTAKSQDYIQDYNEFLDIGENALVSKDYQTAIDCLTKCIEIASEHINEYMKEYIVEFVRAYYSRGMAFAYIEKFDDSIRDLTKIIEDIDSSFAFAYASRGMVIMTNAMIFKTDETEIEEDFKKAWADFEIAIRLDPKLEETIKDYINLRKKELDN